MATLVHNIPISSTIYYVQIFLQIGVFCCYFHFALVVWHHYNAIFPSIWLTHVNSFTLPCVFVLQCNAHCHFSFIFQLSPSGLINPWQPGLSGGLEFLVTEFVWQHTATYKYKVSDRCEMTNFYPLDFMACQ